MNVSAVSRTRLAAVILAALASVVLIAAARSHFQSSSSAVAAPSRRAPAAPSVAPGTPADAAPPESAPRATPTVIWMTGDVLLDPAFRRSGAASGDPAEAYASMIAPVAKHWRADGDEATVIVNLESPVATLRREPDAYVDQAEEIFERTGHRRIPSPLNAPQSLLDALARSGVDAVDLANNHALDQDRAGLAETLDAAQARGLTTLGAGRSDADARAPRLYGPPGARIAVLATFVRDRAEPAWLSANEARLSVVDARTIDEVRRAAETSDAVIVAVHVVAELLARPTPGTRELVAALIAAGADLVVVHGPHVIAPVERIESGGRSGIAAFSIGNFVSDMGKEARPGRDDPPRAGEAAADKWHDPRTRSGLVVRVALAPGAPLDVAFLPTWMHSDRWLIDQGLARPPITFSVEPLAACGPPLQLRAAWPPEGYDAMESWVARHRDAALATAGITSAACARCTDGAPCRWRGDAHLLRLP